MRMTHHPRTPCVGVLRLITLCPSGACASSVLVVMGCASLVGKACRRKGCGTPASGQAGKTRPSLHQYSLCQSCAAVLLILVVVMVFPVAIITPVGGVSIHHTRLGHYDRRF